MGICCTSWVLFFCILSWAWHMHLRENPPFFWNCVLLLLCICPLSHSPPTHRLRQHHCLFCFSDVAPPQYVLCVEGGELLSLHFYLKIKSSDWCLQKDLFLLGSVYAMQWHARFYFFFRKIYLKKRTLLFCRDISCVLYWYTLHVVLPGQDMLMPK